MLGPSTPPPLASSKITHNLTTNQRNPDLPTARDVKDWQRHTFTDGMGDAKEDEVQDRYTDRITDKHMGAYHCFSGSDPVTQPPYMCLCMFLNLAGTVTVPASTVTALILLDKQRFRDSSAGRDQRPTHRNYVNSGSTVVLTQ